MVNYSHNMEPSSGRQRLLAPSKSGSVEGARVPLGASSRTGKFSCEHCERSFIHKSSLGRHVREAHQTYEETTRFLCDKCGRSFQRPEGVKNHIARNRCGVFGTRTLLSCLEPPIETTDSSWFSPDTHLLTQYYLTGVSRQDAHRDARSRLLELHEWGGSSFITRVQHGPITIEYRPIPWDDPDEWSAHLAEYEEYVNDWPRQEEERKRQEEERKRQRCKEPRTRYNGPLPPAFDVPTPQNLEDLIEEQYFDKRRVRMMESFQSTYRKFTQSCDASGIMNLVPEDNCKKFLNHRSHSKQAWQDGMDAALGLLSGTLPRELHSVLGIAQIASAIRAAIDDIDSPMASEGKFLSDLSRWRQILPSNLQPAFDHYADLLWETRPSSDVAWEKPQDADVLVYFQDLLAEMLRLIELPESESNVDEPGPSSSNLVSECPVIASSSSGLSTPFLAASSSTFDEHTVEMACCVEPVPVTLAEVVLYSAGAIFGLIMAYLLRKSSPAQFPGHPADTSIQYTWENSPPGSYVFVSSRTGTLARLILAVIMRMAGIPGYNVNPFSRIAAFLNFCSNF